LAVAALADLKFGVYDSYPMAPEIKDSKLRDSNAPLASKRLTLRVDEQDCLHRGIGRIFGSVGEYLHWKVKRY